MENLKMTELPKTLNGHILNVPEQSWNKLISYIQGITTAINMLNKNLEQLAIDLNTLTTNFNENLISTNEQLATTRKNISIIAEALGGLLQND